MQIYSEPFETTYYQMGTDLGLNSLNIISTKDFLGGRSLNNEEALQTFIMLHLNEITNEELKFCSSSMIHSGNIDLTAIDKLNRVHLFEIKKIADLNTIEQIQNYLFQLVLISKKKFFNNISRVEFTSPNALPMLLCGLYTDTRMETLKKINSITFDKLEELLKRDSKIGDIDNFKDISIKWKNKFENQGLVPFKNIVCANNFTVWIIASNFKDDVKFRNKIIELRSWGIDIRLVKVHIKINKKEKSYFVELEREKIPIIDQVNQELKKIEKYCENNINPRLYFIKYFSIANPSQKDKSKSGQISKSLKEALIRLDERGNQNSFIYHNAKKRTFSNP